MKQLGFVCIVTLIFFTAAVEASVTAAQKLLSVMAIPTLPTSTTVQTKSGAAYANSKAVTFTSSVTAGNMLIACMLTDPGATPWILDNTGNLWALDVLRTTSGGSASCWHASSAIAGATTVTAMTSGTYVNLSIAELTNVNALDTTGTSTGSGTSVSLTTAGSVASGTEVVVAFGADWNGNSTWSTGASNTIIEQNNDATNGDSTALATKNARTGLSGTQNITLTKTMNGNVWTGVIATYRLSNFALTGITPATGNFDGGTVLTLTGKGFDTGAASVTVGGSACTGVNVVSATTLTCTTPAGTQTTTAVDVALTVGGNTVTLAKTFRYVPWLIQHANATASSGNMVVAYPSAPTLNNILIVCAVTPYSAPTISDSNSNTWIVDSTYGASKCWHAVAKAGATTVTIGGATQLSGVSILEVSGIATSSTVYATAVCGNTTGGALSCSTGLSPAGALYALAIFYDRDTAVTWSAGTGAQIVEQSGLSGGNYVSVVMENSNRVNTGGPYTMTGTKTGTGGTWLGSIILYNGK
ncbi:MAG TPA: IPT/TIG domain-containing protein [Bdellovibrionales bacterium]|nr:IPT/TIG domain-containing protein [Bdellovibrionales bacterium]